MQFKKGKKIYCDHELLGDVSNYFTFCLKDMMKGQKVSDKPPVSAEDGLFLPEKEMVSAEKDQLGWEEINKVTFKRPIEEKKMTESLILCIDLSGSMNLSYESNYVKQNEDYVARIIGKQNFDYLKKKLGDKKVLKDYKMIQMYLNEGQTPRSIYEMYKADENRSHGSSSKVESEEEVPLDMTWISRKEAVEIGVANYIQMIKSRNPETLITVVYFSNTIEIPIKNFTDRMIIHDVQLKTVEEMLSLGEQYAKKISIEKAESVGDRLIQNLMKTEANGQTALTPALLFCVGMCKKLNHSLHQIVVVTDGYSNIGVGEVQDEQCRPETKKLYSEIGMKYAKQNNCVVNIITFEDCTIGYDIIDEVVGGTGGLPCQIMFHSFKGEKKLITEETINTLNFSLVEDFIGAIKQMANKAKMFIGCSNQKVSIKLPEELKHYVKKKTEKGLFLDLGIKSIGEKFSFQFYLPQLPQDGFSDPNLTFTVITQYEKGNNHKVSIRSERIHVKKGSKSDAEHEQTKIISKDIKKKVNQHMEIFEEDLNEYDKLEQQLEKENIAKQLDEQLVQKFKKKKKQLENYNDKLDKLAKEKLSMQSRTHKTYRNRDDEDEDDDFK